MKKALRTKKRTALRCDKCFITLEKLKKDKLSPFLIKITDGTGGKKQICRLCFEDW